MTNVFMLILFGNELNSRKALKKTYCRRRHMYINDEKVVR